MSKKLTILNPEHPMVVPFDQQLTIGRDVYNSLSLPDSDISRSHAILFEHDELATIKDLNSRNGVYVNGVRVKEQLLKDGDEIVLGSTVMIYNPPEKFDAMKALSPRGEYILKKQPSQKKPEGEKVVSIYTAQQMDRVIQRLFNQPEGATFFSLANAMALLRAFYDMASSPNTNELFRSTLKRTLNLLGGDRGVIMEAEPGKKKLKVRSIISHDENAAKIEIPNEVLKVVLQQESCVFCPNVLNDERFERIVSKERHPVHSFVAAPILSHKNYLGFIYLDSENRSREYDYIALRSLYLVASLLAALLQPRVLHFAHEPIRSEIAETI
ncbi:FHA domain-containing protein [Candidatus Sumerlaeota bacterium]|nr:FHA domain-containing protein [Candidatus Sumerlaeota bacterium]MBI3736161.1 FHA domain-containing protein [Candidatus Sumerlaeota bacterium]